MLKARDIITTNVISVKENTPIIEAISLLSKNNITGIPVVEDDMTLVGILSEKDMLRLFEASPEELKKTVRDFMTQPAVNFDDDESLPDICECLMDSHFRRVPVTLNGKLVGIVSRRDFVNLIIKQNIQE